MFQRAAVTYEVVHSKAPHPLELRADRAAQTRKAAALFPIQSQLVTKTTDVTQIADVGTNLNDLPHTAA